MGCQESSPVKSQPPQQSTAASQTSFSSTWTMEQYSKMYSLSSSSGSTTRRLYETPPNSACRRASGEAAAEQPPPDPMRPSAAAASDDPPASSPSPMTPHSAPRTPVTPITADEEDRLQQQREERAALPPHQPVSPPGFATALSAATEEHSDEADPPNTPSGGGSPVDVPRLKLPGGAVTPPADDALEDSWVGGSSMTDTDSVSRLGSSSGSSSSRGDGTFSALSCDSLGMTSPSKRASFAVSRRVTPSRSMDAISDDDVDVSHSSVSIFAGSNSNSSSRNLDRFTPQISPSNSASQAAAVALAGRSVAGAPTGMHVPVDLASVDSNSSISGGSGESNRGQSAASSVCSWDDDVVSEREDQQEPPRGSEKSGDGDCDRRWTFNKTGPPCARRHI